MEKKTSIKTILPSTAEIGELIDECISLEAKERYMSQSLILEEYILSGIARNHPDKKVQIKEIFMKRYRKYLDDYFFEKENNEQENSN